jgi:hypothetical protein
MLLAQLLEPVDLVLQLLWNLGRFNPSFVMAPERGL